MFRWAPSWLTHLVEEVLLQGTPSYQAPSKCVGKESKAQYHTGAISFREACGKMIKKDSLSELCIDSHLCYRSVFVSVNSNIVHYEVICLQRKMSVIWSSEDGFLWQQAMAALPHPQLIHFPTIQVKNLGYRVIFASDGSSTNVFESQRGSVSTW